MQPMHLTTNNTFLQSWQRMLLVVAILIAVGLVITGCTGFGLAENEQQNHSGIPKENSRPLTPWDIASNLSQAGQPPSAWQHRTFPSKQPTQFKAMQIDSRIAMQAVSNQSASMLRQSIRMESAQLNRISFSWKVGALIAGADLGQRSGEDSPARLVLVFDGHSNKNPFSTKDAMLSELALTLTGEPLPYATLIYAWDNQHPVGSIFNNHRTDRIRKIVLESGPDKVGQWLDYERDIRADFEKAFGEPPGALLSVGIMTDTDNTKTSTTAWYGPVRLLSGR